MSEIDKTRWQQMARAANGYSKLLGQHKREHGHLHDPDFIAGAASQTTLIINELPKARGAAPVEAGALAAAGLQLTDAAELKGEPAQRMTTEAICTLGSLRQGNIPAKYGDHLRGALYRYGVMSVIKEAKERDKARGTLSGRWGSTSTPNTPYAATEGPANQLPRATRRPGFGGADNWP